MASSIKTEKLNEEDRLVAVIIADTFNNNFYPAIQDSPVALLSLVNNPLIFYSLEWLKQNKVDDTIIYCNFKDAEEIRSHCKKWSSVYGNCMKLMVISSDSCSSLGDAMRDLYSKSLLKKDFVLLDGFVVGNTNLRKAVEKHRENVAADPTCIMTCLYRKIIGAGGLKPMNMDNTRIAHLLLNGKTMKILIHYRPTKPSKLLLPTRLFAENRGVRIWSLEDPHVSICSERVPMLFSDNFDYGSRDSLIQGLIEQEELLNCSLRAYIPKEGYMQLVSSFRAYEEISMGIVKRWFSPLVPERSLSTQRIRYKYDDWYSSYYDESAKFHRNALGDYNVVDAGSEIDQRCKMKNSVVGKHCTIIGNVTINDSFLGDNVTIGCGCILDNCFVGSNVKLLPGVHLEPGVILGPNTVLGPNLKVDRCKKLISNPLENSKGKVRTVVWRAFEVQDDEEPDEEEEMLEKYGIHDLKWGQKANAITNLPSDSDDSLKGTDEAEVVYDADEFSSDEEREQEFEREVMDSLLNAYCDKSRLSSVMLELNSSRHAYNVSMENVLRVVVKAVLHVVEKSEEESGSAGDELWKHVQKGLECFGDLLSKYIKSPKHQVIVLNCLETLVNEEERYLRILQNILYKLNQDLEIIYDEVISIWYSNGGHKTQKFPLIAKKIQKFVEWLEQDSEEDDEEEEDST